MSSKSRFVLEELERFEQLSKSFEEQLTESAKFVGVKFTKDGKISEDKEEAKRLSKVVPFKREEWLLIWLVKKLKVEESARKMPSSWWLLNFLVRSLPKRSATRILLTKEVFVEERDNPSKQLKTSILQKTLEETLFNITPFIPPKVMDQKNTKDHSRKRKRCSEQNASDKTTDYLPDLMEAISTVLSYVVEMGSLTATDYSNDIEESFSAAYMKTTYVTSAEKAALILGLWITLCEKYYFKIEITNISIKENLLTPFIELWDCRVWDEKWPMAFSKYCSLPIFSFLNKVKHDINNYELKSQLEKLLARNIAVPAKKAYHQESCLALLESLANPVIALHILNAPTLLEIFLRSSRQQNHKHWLPEDEKWLQAVFKSLIHSVPDPQNEDFICAMLELLIDYKVDLDLELLHSLAFKLALPELAVKWRLVATLIKFDANIFLVPKDNNLLEILLDRITDAPFDLSWAAISDYMVSSILVPLMVEFARARDLLSFIKIWFNQISKFENRRKNLKHPSTARLSAWENDALHSKLRELLESSLTISQISYIIDWVSENVSKDHHAACIIFEAIVGCISGQEDIVDIISLRPYYIIFDKERYMSLNIRYRWRAWRLLNNLLNWANAENINELTNVWETKFNPLSFYLENLNSLVVAEPEEYESISEPVEVFRSVCAAYCASISGSNMEAFIGPVLLSYLQLVAKDILKYREEVRLKTNKNESRPDTMDRLLRCVFVEYPKILTLAFEFEEKFEHVLRAVFDIASESLNLSNTYDVPHFITGAYTTLWTSAIQSDVVLDNQKLKEFMIGTMLTKLTLERDSICNNHFAIMSLNQMPLDVIRRNNREDIMRAWLFPPNKEMTITETINYSCKALDPALLALKRRIMKQHPNLYEGLELESIVAMADSLSNTKISQKDVRLSLLKDLTNLIIGHAQINLDQERRKIYIIKAFKSLQNRIQNLEEKKKSHRNFEFIPIFEAALVGLNRGKKYLEKMGVIKEIEIKNITNRFREYLLARFKKTMENILIESHRESRIKKNKETCLLVIIDALTSLGVTRSQLSNLELESVPQKLAELSSKIALSINTFITIFESRNEIIDLKPLLGLDVTTYLYRKSIQQTVEGVMNKIDNLKKLQMLRSLLRGDCDNNLTPDKILAMRYIIISTEDVKSKRKPLCSDSDDSNNSSDNSVQDDFNLNLVYILLNTELRKTIDIISFCILSETLDLMLRTKPRSISQYTVDITLGTICILCSPESPHLPTKRPGTIFLHLSKLLRSILNYHRLKLNGHFPLVQLSMQGLLRCLFQFRPKKFCRNITDTSTSNPTIAEFDSMPIWLTNTNYQLNARNAESYTRLLTLISDPSESSVQGSKYRISNHLTSAADKWKRRAVLFMRFVLMSYIRWTLKFPMLPEIKEQLMPGWFALLDNTTTDTRRLINAELLNSSNRAIFTNLYREYQKFGKWNGS
ncbi:putative urb2 npa2 family protein [Erysiphe necator]|uniref:Putative urb2 npa2 family protein n=1 Tax=Uncinula necator TaxID=52586 RepID=A0A0B1P458_UNCNE|nr:putative urb2 npa2 family protein [Erysiphe necator]